MKNATKKIKIELINYGLAYTVFTNSGEKYIQINKNLLKYPELYNKVLEHELEHINMPPNGSHILFDLKESLKIDQLKYFWFYIKHPSAFLSSFPILIDKGKIVILPYNMLVMIIFILSIIYLTIVFK